MIDPLKIHALVDGELNDAEKRAVEAAIASDPAAQAEYENVLAIKDCVRDKVDPIECDDVWAQCSSRLKEIDRVKRVESFVGRYSWALCALFFMAILVGGMINQQTGGSDVRMSQMFGARLMPFGPGEDVIQQAKSLFGRGEAASFNSKSLTIIGGAAGYANDRRVARIDLADDQGALQLYIIEGVVLVDSIDQVPSSSEYLTGEFDGVNGVVWADGPVTFALVADRSMSTLRAIARAINE